MYAKDKYARDRVMKAARLLLPYIDFNGGSTVLDVGCFTQEARKYLPSGTKYIGVDSTQYHKDTIVRDLNSVFDALPCTAALCLETLEHLLHPAKVLQMLRASLPEKGVLVVSLPNEATLFHRIRCLLGTVDGEAFSDEGKHLHLPSLRQAQAFLSTQFEIVKQYSYISPSACGSRQEWVGRILALIPDRFLQWFANSWPSLFARGWIFLLKKRDKSVTVAQTS